MIPTATFSPTLPTPARSTTVQNGPTPGDFAGSFAQANDDAAAEGAPTPPTPIVASPVPSSGTTTRQDAAATGNTLPTPSVTEGSQSIVPAIVTLLAEPLAAGPRTTSLPLVQPAIPANPEPATPDVATRTITPRPSPSAARPAAFAIAPRGGKAKNDTPTTPSDDTADATSADQPASPGVTAVAQPAIDPPAIALPRVEASSTALPLVPLAPLPRTEGIRTIEVDDAVAPVVAGSAIGGAKPIGTSAVAAKPLSVVEPDVTAPTSTAPAPTPSGKAAKIAQAEPAVPLTIPVAPISIAQIPATPHPVLRPVTLGPVTPGPAVQRSALPVASALARPVVQMVDPGRTSPPQVTPVGMSPGIPVASPPVANPPSQIAALAAAVPSSVILSPGLAIEQGSTAQSIDQASIAVSPAIAADAPPVATPRWVATDATTPVALALAQPPAIQPQPGTVASASQVFGAAIQAATKARDERDATDPTAPSIAAGAPVSPQTIKAPEAQQTPLDMRQERWPHAMIERIEILRDAADATDTRIRLVPDALGAIDVSMRKDGDTVHVHFNADQAATRTLLQDAQPRLVELAEARGLKLGQGALGDSAASSSQQRAPTAPHTPNRPTTAPAAVIDDAHDDTRIA